MVQLTAVSNFTFPERKKAWVTTDGHGAMAVCGEATEMWMMTVGIIGTENLRDCCLWPPA